MDSWQDWQESSSQPNSAWNTETSLVHWSSPGLKWLVNITNSRMCMCACAPREKSKASYTAQHLSSCQGDLHPLPELWSEASLSMECRTELRLAGKHKSWLPNPVLSRTRPQWFSGESWQRRIEKWARVFHCVTVCLQLRLLTFAMLSNQLHVSLPRSAVKVQCV